MTHPRPYRPSSTRPHPYGVRHWSCPAIATEPCRPTACVRERPCSPNGEDGLGKTPSYRASAPNGAGDVGSRSTVHCSLLTVHWTFTFSAKERDSETGLSYFGSRYYSSNLSIWLSVDPMSDKYASLSPYTYCADNPVKLVDPNGEEIVIFVNKTKYTYNGKDFVDGNGNVATFSKNSFEYRVLSDLNKLYNSKSDMIRGKLQDMMKSKHQHSIVNRTTSDGVGFNCPIDEDLAKEHGKGSGTVTGYNPFATESVCADGGYVSCATLAHELLGHGWNNDQGLHESDDHRTENGIKYEEINAVNIQNKVLVEYHQKPRSLVGKPDETKQIPLHLINHYYTTKPE